jgi:hypothetical protein
MEEWMFGWMGGFHSSIHPIYSKVKEVNSNLDAFTQIIQPGVCSSVYYIKFFVI